MSNNVSIPLNLGYNVLCLNASDVEVTKAFYRKLGFRTTGFNIPKEVRTLVQGRIQLAFFSFYNRPNVNFRGPNIPLLAMSLAGRGFQITSNNLVWDEERKRYCASSRNPKAPDASECGSFVIFDPAGFDLFFNTNPGERAPYERTRSNPVFSDSEGWPPGFQAESVQTTIPLGELVICMDVPDLEAVVGFYSDLGLTVIDSNDNSAMLGYHVKATTADNAPSSENIPYLKDISFAFWCDDVEEASNAIERTGIDLVETDYGPSFVDPDNREVALMTRNASSTSVKG